MTWQGSTRRPLVDADVHPKTARGPIPTWVGVGGSPESVVRAARYGLPLVLAIIGGDPARFAPYAELYHRALERARAAGRCRSACTPPASSPRTDEEARDRCGRTPGRCATGSAASAAGRRPPATSSTPRRPQGA